LSLPQILSTEAAQDAWVVALLGTVLEICILFLVLNIVLSNQKQDIAPNKSLLSHIARCSVLVLMLFVFVLQLIIIMRLSHTLLNDNLFDSMSDHLFVIPLLFFGVLFCFVPGRAIFRSGEVFYLLIFIGLALSVLPAITQMNFNELTPVLGTGAGSIFRGLYHNLIYFESASFILIFGQDIKTTKNFRKKFMTTAIILGVVFVLFILMFTAVFGPLAETKSTAIADLTLYSKFLTRGGRMDWILICIWLLLLLVRFGATFFAAFVAIKYIFKVEKRAGYIGFMLAGVLYVLYAWAFTSRTVFDNFLHDISPLITALYFVIPLAFFIGMIIRKKNAGKKQLPNSNKSTKNKRRRSNV